MAIDYVRRQTDVAPGRNSKPNANPLFVDSDTDTLKFGTGASGTTTKEVVDVSSTQTLTSKTLTAPTITSAAQRKTFQTVAAAGSTVADGGAIAAGSGGLVLATGANATKGVVLPTGVAGDFFVIKNDDAANAVLKVYAASGGKINNGASDAALSMAAKTCATLYCIAADSWVSSPLLPS